jgi:hypothetical protein
MIKKRYNFPADRTILVYDFLNRFGVHPNGYIDNLMSAISKHFVIDICKFDDYLHEKFGDYDDGENAISMEALILKEYGVEASNLIESLL